MRKFKSYIICLLICYAGFSFHLMAQNNRSLIRADNKNQISILLDSASISLEDAPDKSFGFVERALELSITSRDRINEARCYYLLGQINASLQQYDLSINYFKKSIKVFAATDINAMYQNYPLLAGVYEKNNNPAASINYYEDYLDHVINKNHTDRIITTRYNLARVYTSLGEYNKALKEYDEIQKMEVSRNNQAGLADVSTKQGDVYLKQERPEKAISNYKKSVEIADKSKDQNRKSNSLRSLGKAYRSTQQYEEELDVRQQSLQISEETEKKEDQVADNLAVGEIYINRNQPEQAVQYIQKSIDLSEEIGDIKNKSVALKTLSKAYKDQGEYDKALLTYQEYAITIDSMYSQRERKLESNLEIVANVGRKLQRIELLEKDFEITKKTLSLLEREKDINSRELQTQKRIIYSLFFIVLILLITSIFIYRSSIQKRKANLLLALRSLRSQMNPHFIFNSLNSVNSFIAQNDERKANKYLSDFSSLMRSVMENSKHDFVPFSSEIEILELYLKLEHFRFQDKFDYTIEIDESINQSDVEIPPMLIQPYIENAVWHGLRYKKEKGFLELKITKEGESLSAIITDNGIGRGKSQEMKTKHQKANTSTGLKNTETRLKIINEIYKTQFTVSIKDLDEKNRTGTIVKIKIPISNGVNI